jgi:hypothetical protein
MILHAVSNTKPPSNVFRISMKLRAGKYSIGINRSQSQKTSFLGHWIWAFEEREQAASGAQVACWACGEICTTDSHTWLVSVSS